MRFPLAVIDQIHKKCGNDFPVLIRYSVDEWVPGGREVEESKLVAKVMEQAGVAALDLSMCIQESPGAGFDPMHYDEGWTMYASQAIKQVVKIPVINSHTLRNPDYCEKILAEGKTDMVGLSRQLLADPYWPIKARYGKVSSIRRCINCLGGCWQESLMAKKEIACTINPACGNPDFARMQPSKRPLKVAVVGGGPAGMEAARVATVRGHLVTLYEKTGELGGAILGCCMVPGKEKMRWYLDWIRDEVRELGVDVRLGRAPGVEELRAYDVILNATGASSYVPEVFGQRERVIPFEQTMACPRGTCEYHPGNRVNLKLGRRVLVWGDHYAAADTAAFLASIGKEVTIVTENREFGAKVEVIHMYVLRKRFAQTDAEALESKPFRYPVTVIPNTMVAEIREGEVMLQDKNFARTTLAVDDIVTCHTRSNTALLNELAAAGLRVINAGDSVHPRSLFAAVREGASFGLNLDEELLFNPNHAMVNELPVDVLGQLRRPEMIELK
jgi:thioredoxin reductase